MQPLKFRNGEVISSHTLELDAITYPCRRGSGDFVQSDDKTSHHFVLLWSPMTVEASQITGIATLCFNGFRAINKNISKLSNFAILAFSEEIYWILGSVSRHDVIIGNEASGITTYPGLADYNWHVINAKCSYRHWKMLCILSDGLPEL